MAGLLAAAALATGAAAIVNDDPAAPARPSASVSALHSAPAPPTAAAAPAGAAPARASRRAARRHAAAQRHRAVQRQRRSAPVETPATTPSATAAPAAEVPVASQPTAGTPLRDGVDRARTLLDPVTTKLPAGVRQPLQRVLDGATDTLDSPLGVLDRLLP